MPRQESAGSVRDWVERETTHIDVVASWESLCGTYEALRFSDHLSDAERLDEYKWIVQQMNSFLSKVRTRLLSCRDIDAMLEMLGSTFTPAGKVELSTRKALVYQKLRQQWIRTSMAELQVMRLQTEETEDQDGWTD
jgi:hypothetical protein